MGIMVKGGVFRCFGSSQHIKNKFGTGYEVEIKVKMPEIEDIKELRRKYPMKVDTSGYVLLDEAKYSLKAGGFP